MHLHHDGRLAQLVEHLPYKEGVTGSSPVSPTILIKNERCDREVKQ